MDVFCALAEPRRRRIVEMLAKSEGLSATRIYEGFDISPQAVSQHLGILRNAGVVLMEKRAQRRIYRINPHSMDELTTWANRMTELWNGRFDRLNKILETEKKKNIKR